MPPKIGCPAEVGEKGFDVKLNGNDVRSLAVQFLKDAGPEGMTVAVLNRAIVNIHRDMVIDGRISGTVRGATWNLQDAVVGVVKTPDKRLVWSPDGKAPAATQKPAKEPKREPKGGDVQTLKEVQAQADTLRNTLEQVRSEKAGVIVEMNKAKAARDKAIADLAEALVERDKAIAARDKAIAERDAARAAIASVSKDAAEETDGARLKRLRKAAGLTSPQLAEKLGISRGRVATLEMQARIPPSNPAAQWMTKQERRG